MIGHAPLHATVAMETAPRRRRLPSLHARAHLHSRRRWQDRPVGEAVQLGELQSAGVCLMSLRMPPAPMRRIVDHHRSAGHSRRGRWRIRLRCRGTSVGHAGLVDDDQRRRSDPRRLVRKSAVSQRPSQCRLVAQMAQPPPKVHWCVRSLENSRFSGRASIEYSQPRVSSIYDVAWRYHQVTPQVRRAQTVMPVELLTFLFPGNTEPCVDQRSGPLRRTPRRSPIHRQTAPTPTPN